MKTRHFSLFESTLRQPEEGFTPEDIKEQIKAFKAKGGKIQKIPPGISAVPINRGPNVQISLGSPRK